MRDAQVQLGHAKMSTTLEIYTLPQSDSQREAVETLARLMANDGELAKSGIPQICESPRIQ